MIWSMYLVPMSDVLLVTMWHHTACEYHALCLTIVPNFSQMADLLSVGDTNSTYICTRPCSSHIVWLVSIQIWTNKMQKNRIYLVAGMNMIACVSSLYPGWKYRDEYVLLAKPYCHFWFHFGVKFFTRFDVLFDLVRVSLL